MARQVTLGYDETTGKLLVFVTIGGLAASATASTTVASMGMMYAEVPV